MNSTENSLMTIKQLRQEIVELKKVKQQLEYIINTLPVHIYWLDKNNTFLGCNTQQAKTIGLKSNQEIIGKTISNFQTKENADVIIQNNNEIMTRGITKIIEEKSFSNDGQSEGIYLSHKTPLRDKKNNIIGLLGISFDITSRKKIEQELRKAKLRAETAEKENLKYLAKMNKLITGQEQTIQKSAEEHTAEMVDYLNNLIALIPGHIYWLDKNNIFLGCNDQQAKTIGLSSRHEIVGKTVYDFQNKENADAIIKNNNKIMATKISQLIEEKAFLADGHTQGTYLSYKTPLYDKKNNVIGLLGTSFDITERKELEEKLKRAKEKADAANIAKTEFIANISHDVRTPISGIIGMAQVLESRLKEFQNISFVKQISKSANQLLTILNEVIDYSKIETHQQPIRQNKFNLKDIIKDVIKSFSTYIKEKHLRIKVNYFPRAQNFIGDKIRIYRILLNLVSNSIKFTESGNIYINIFVNEKKNNKVILKLEVSDTGVGIPNDVIHNIFEKFTRISSSYRNVHQGSGLGLAIVKRFVVDLGGTIEVTSQINKGTTFTCLIPLTLTSKNLSETKIVFKKLSKIKNTNKLNILLVEDDKTCQLSQQILLTDMGHIVDIANSGISATNLITKPYDLIITDIGLSDLDGNQLARIIRKSDNNRLTPIIALTAHLSEENKTQCFNSGIDMVLHKPMNLQEIQHAIHILVHDTQKKSNTN